MIENGQNPDKVEFFDLRDYISTIKLDSNVLAHMEDTNKEFDEYMRKINSYNHADIIHYWLINNADELVNSNRIEKHYIKKQDILKEDLFIKTLDINHERIHEIHKFALQDEKYPSSYRTTPVRVSAMNPYTEEEMIYWHGAEPTDVNKFMNLFLDVYKSKDLSVINSNPFLKSALVHLLFTRIHPYTDGNGRTARLLHSIKFTESINNIYGTNYKLCPLNISGSILINQLTYVNILNNIYFDLKNDNTKYFNKWFDFILNMVDEQLYYSKNHLEHLDKVYDLYKMDDKKFDMVLNRILLDMMNVEELNEEESQKIFKLK